MQRNWIGRSHGARITLRRRLTTRHRGLHHPAGHRVRRDLPGAGAGTPAGGPADGGRVARRHGRALDRRRRDPGRGGRRVPAGRVAASPTWTARRTRRRPASSPAPTRRTRSTAARIPVFIADYVLMGYGTGAIMAVPGQDQRDWDFAVAFGLPIIRTVQPADGFDGEAFTGDGPGDQLEHEASWTGWTSPRPRRRSSRGWRSTARGEGTVQYKLRDWLFARQRYWGEPFPIVYDETGLPIAAARRASCRSSCPRSTTTPPPRSTPTTRTPSPRRRWPGRPTGSPSSWTWATARRPTGATRT